VDGLKTSGTFHTWGAVFKHVTLRGKIGDIMISPAVNAGLAKPAEHRACDEANAAYYASVDWALDIREAEFEGADRRGVPGHLVRRDPENPETHVLVMRAKALERRWRHLDLSKTYWPTTLEFFVEDANFDSTVLVAPKRIGRSGPWTYQNLLDGLGMLRDAGIAEPD
jgi:hypothetical protein